jgi:hypothetical protein
MAKRNDGIEIGTEVATPNGFVNAEDIRRGDTVFDESGAVCNVVKASKQYVASGYRLVFDDDTEIVCGGEHRWLTWTKANRDSFQSRKTPSQPTIKPTVDIAQTLRVSLKHDTNHSIPCCKPLQYPHQELLIDPYVLGAWLGDGETSTGRIECADPEILEEINKAGYSTIRKHVSSTAKPCKSSSYRIGDLEPDHIKDDGTPSKRLIGELKKQLKQLQLIGSKHIPLQYHYADSNQRLALLQGLMDTDGSCAPGGKVEWCSVLPILADQTLLLCNSLGLKPHLHRNENWLYDHRCKDRYRIALCTSKPVFRLERKLARIPKEAKGNRSIHHYVRDIQPLEQIPMISIEVDSPSGQFVITRSFIATHGNPKHKNAPQLTPHQRT